MQTDVFMYVFSSRTANLSFYCIFRPLLQRHPILVTLILGRPFKAVFAAEKRTINSGEQSKKLMADTLEERPIFKWQRGMSAPDF